MGRKLVDKLTDYLIIGLGLVLGVCLIAMGVDTIRRMHLPAADAPEDTPDE